MGAQKYSRLFWLSLIVAASFMTSLQLAAAVECGITPTNGCEVTQTTTFTNGVYNLPDGIKFIGNPNPGPFGLGTILNCNGATLVGDKSNAGIRIFNVSGGSILNCKINNYTHAISGVCDGQTCGYFNHTRISLNRFNNNDLGVVLEGSQTSFYNTTFVNASGSVFNTSIPVTVHNITVSLNLFNNTEGAAVRISDFSENNTVRLNVFDGQNMPNARAIYLTNAHRNRIRFNIIFRYPNCVEFLGGGINTTAMNNQLFGNIISFCGEGLILDGLTAGNLLINNSFMNNSMGIHLIGSQGNNITNNTFFGGGSGIMIGGSDVSTSSISGNHLLFNNFIDNTMEAEDEGDNVWNTGNLGNHWKSYLENCADANFDNICDDPYPIDIDTDDDFPSRGLLDPEAVIPSLELISPVVVDEADTITIVANPTTHTPNLRYFSTNGSYFDVNDNIITHQTNFTSAGSFNTFIVVENEYNYVAAQQLGITINDVTNTECGNIPRNSCTVSQHTLFDTGIGVQEFVDGFYVVNDDIVLDCNNNGLFGRMYGEGIRLVGRNNVTVKNCEVTNYTTGIEIENTPFASVVDSSIKWNDGKALKVTNSNNATIEGNTIQYNNDGMTLDTVYYSDITNNVIGDNSNEGLMMMASDFNNIISNVLNDNMLFGISADASDNNNFQSNTMTSSAVGLRLTGSNNNVINENTIEFNTGGLLLSSSHGGVVTNNMIADNEDQGTGFGLKVTASNNGVVTGNDILRNHRGLHMHAGSANNQIYRNNVEDNTEQTLVVGTNVFDVNGEGNYWSHYDEPSEGCVDINLDGICDAPLSLNINGVDNYPFTMRNGWSSFVCQEGNVNAGVGTVTSTLLVDGQDGGPSHTVDIPLNTPFDVAMLNPPAGPAGSTFVVYAMVGEVSTNTVTTLPANLGIFCMNPPIFGGVNTFTLMNSWDPGLGLPVFTSTATPSVTAIPPIGAPLTVTIQGAILDTGSAHPSTVSLTNAVTVRIS